VSCGPILISYIAGTNKNIPKGLKDYFLFSLARIFVYILLALVIFFLGSFTLERLLGRYSKYVFILGGGFIVLVGIAMALGQRLEFKLWKFIQKNTLQNNKQSPIILGLIMGFSPCAPLLAMLSYIGLVSKSWFYSLLYGISFGLGTFLSPVILLIILTGFIPKLLIPRQAVYSRIFSFICGLIIMFLGVQLLTRGI
jgi:sulfite exporter TauE/SafE